MSFDASVTIHCNDCEIETSYEEPAQGSTDGASDEPVNEPAVYKEWVWCKDPMYNETTYFWDATQCVDVWDGEDYEYYLMNGCSNCVGDECHDCDWWTYADDSAWKDEYPEAIYCEAPKFDDW
jgi:hypothetical protein